MVYLLAAAAAAGLAGTALIYNRLVASRNRVREGWSGIDVQLKRRHDLVPALVAAVAGYRDHERTVLEEVARARSNCLAAQDLPERARAENDLARSLKSLFAVSEAYPELAAGAQFLSLQQRLSEIEDAIQMARRYYNGAVRDYNILIESFPSSLVARLGGFAPRSYFQLDDPGERDRPGVGEELR
ncbi:MAG TPA: LemA family protein [bacterium]|nr:LemA family protein [bacterium]HPJ71313.1 LemA family protein [bacterium]HPQ66952.1 LemA family protein [bacterium]